MPQQVSLSEISKCLYVCCLMLGGGGGDGEFSKANYACTNVQKEIVELLIRAYNSMYNSRFNGSRAILSGPAGGVVGYALTTYNRVSSLPVIGFDMGGES